MLDTTMAIYPGLAEQAEARGTLANAGRLAAAFRSRGLPVVHAHMSHREDFAGVVPNSPMTSLSLRNRSMTEGTPQVEPMLEVAPEPSDHVSLRTARLGMWYGTDLDAIFRSLRTETIVMCGVSTNVALFGASLGAVDRSYQAVIAEDATAGASAESHEWMITNTLALLATITTTDEVIAALG